MRLGSGVAVAVAMGQAGSYSSNFTPGLGTSICQRCGPRNGKKKTKNKKIKTLGGRNIVSVFVLSGHV